MKLRLSRERQARVRNWLAGQWQEWRTFVLLFCFVWVPLRSAVIDYNPVPTGSMNPTILEGDVVWVNKLAYGLRVPLTQHYLTRWAEPQRGDVVVLISPSDGTRLVKRVVGVPGDTLELHGPQLMLNGRTVEYQPAASDYGATVAGRLRPYAFFAEENLGGVTHPVMGLTVAGGASREFGPVTVPAGRYFLMGDSRDNSLDSRAWGFAPRESILGKAKGVLVSLDLNDSYLPRLDRFFTPLP